MDGPCAENTVGISFCFITTGTPLDRGQDEQKLRDYTVRNYLTAEIFNMFPRKLEQLLQSFEIRTTEIQDCLPPYFLHS